jgi:CubicO group peptidase (beta-lactamase class C family)
MRNQLLAAALFFLFGMLPLRAADPKDDIAGYWDWTFGHIIIRTAPVKGQDHLSVTGEYLVGPDLKGTITKGTFDPATRVLEYTFQEPWNPGAKGSARYKLSDDGKRFEGRAAIANIKNDVVMTRVSGNTFVARMDSIVANAGIKADTPGTAVLVVEHGKVIVEKCYGIAHFKDKKAITPTTTFELCSCSKQFTGTAILLLQERGLLNVEDDARNYLPELPEYDKKRPIRILDLARHTSGLPEYPWTDPKVKGKNPKFLTNEDFLLELAGNQKKYPLQFKPGEKFEYRNTNYMLLALIVERVTKKSLGTFLKSEIFDRLGMKTATVFERPDTVIEEPALGHTREKGKFKAIWGPAPFLTQRVMSVGDGNIWMSVIDLMHWDAGWREGKVLKPETIKKWLVPSKTRNGDDNGYAFGWGVDVNEGKLLFMRHTGGYGGFTSNVGRDLVTKRTIIVLCNGDMIDPVKISSPIDHLCNAMPHWFFWRHKNGYFEYVEKNTWTEKAPDGKTFKFIETDRTDDYVDLYDMTRECTVRLTNTDCQVEFKGGKFEKYYDGKWASK